MRERTLERNITVKMRIHVKLVIWFSLVFSSTKARFSVNDIWQPDSFFEVDVK